MWAEPRIVGEGQRQPALEIGPDQRGPRVEVRDGLESAEESLDEGDGSRCSDGAEAVAYNETAECLLELLRGELRSLVGDGVSRRPEAADCPEE